MILKNNLISILTSYFYKFIIFLVTVISVISFAVTIGKVKAQIIDYKITKEIIFNDDLKAFVRETRERSINTDKYIAELTQENFTISILNPIKTKESLEAIKNNLQQIIILDENKQILQYSINETSSMDVEIKINKNHKLTQTSPSKITLEYKYPLYMFKIGKITDIFVPGFSKDFKFSTQTENIKFKYILKIPKNIAQISHIHPQKNLVTEGEYFKIEYNGDELIGKSIYIQLGKEQSFKFKITKDYKPTIDIPIGINQIKLIVPRDIASGYLKQSVFFTYISPQPSSAEQDENGNIFLNFKLPANKGGQIIIEGISKLEKVLFNHTLSGSLSEIPQNIKEKNTSPAVYWESNSTEIIKTSENILNKLNLNTNFNSQIYEITKAIYEFIIDRIDYSIVKKYGLNERQGALKTLNGGAAVCMEYSDLFIAIARASGIPARAAFGHAYSSIQYNFLDSSEKTINHQWAEVYYPRQNIWVPVDTTWGESGMEVIGGDLNRFYLYVANLDPNTPSSTVIKFIGSETFDAETNYLVYADDFDVDNLNYLSQSDLLTKYPKKENFIASIEESFLTLNNIINYIDLSIDRFISENLGVKSKDQIFLIKIVFFSTILCLVIIYFILLSRKKKIKIKKKINKIKDSII